MAAEIRIPKLGMSAAEVILSEWMHADGAPVEKGEVIYLAETDKTTTEIEAQASGTIRQSGTEGTAYPVGALIGTIE